MKIIYLLYIAIYIFTIPSCSNNKNSCNETYVAINEIIKDNKIQIPYTERHFYTSAEVFDFLDDSIYNEFLSKNDLLEMKNYAKSQISDTIENGKIIYIDTIKNKEFKSRVVNDLPNSIYGRVISKISVPYFNKDKSKAIFIRREIYQGMPTGGSIFISIYVKKNGKWIDISPITIDVA